MTVSVDRFMKQLSDSGVLSAEELATLESKIPSEKRDRDAEPLVRQLVQMKRLTAFQANVLYNHEKTPLILGNYILQDRIGTGGMGVVYRAQHRRMKRTVAIKVLSPEMTTSENIVKRFLREAEAAAKLSHRNIVSAFDADEINGVLFLAMEYVEGKDLAAQVAADGPMDLGKAIDCILQAARGLEHAHQQGIVHRDIKPANILMDAQGTIKILDMGLARFSDHTQAMGVAEAAAITQSGGIVGTVDFMSPEQAVDSKSADQVSDIYSLGATFYFLLTGKPMYDGKNLMVRLVAHRESPIPSICNQRKDAPAQIDTIFRRMVAKKKEDRYPSMSAVIKDLENWQQLSAGPDSSGSAEVSANVPKSVFDVIFGEE